MLPAAQRRARVSQIVPVYIGATISGRREASSLVQTEQPVPVILALLTSQQAHFKPFCKRPKATSMAHYPLSLSTAASRWQRQGEYTATLPATLLKPCVRGKGRDLA